MAGLYTGDKQISGNLEQARIVSKKKPWRDLDLSLKIHPIRKDIIPLKDDVAIKNAVKNLLISNFFERPFQDDLGANLRGLLFEPAGFITEIQLRDNIRTVLNKYEPRVRVTNIDITDLSQQNAYKIIVNFKIKEYDSAASVEIILRRLR
jgi:phage baseplate assembly protein W|tara:strand:- start:1893 stop:2342 length:450 start_codon:yes stop_codon:yes gene_type:complete